MPKSVAVRDPIACCTPVRAETLDQATAETLAHSFAALSDPIRLRLLSFIASADADEVCACDLLEPSGRSQPTVSHHMKILVDAGLVTREKRGLWVWYRLVPSRLDALRSVLRSRGSIGSAIEPDMISQPDDLMSGRNILLITTDQQRYDSLGCNSGTIARTPNVDRLAAQGINYRRAYNSNTVCMPARSTILTGQYVRTHGVVANGIPLPTDAPSVAATLAEAGYRTALFGKAHFEPGWDPDNTHYAENRRAKEGDVGPWRGFDTAIQAMHTAVYPGDRPATHYGYWLEEHHPEFVHAFAPLLDARGGGDTGAPETKNNPMPRELYHTDWVRDHTLAYLDSLRDDELFFVWMSFPDPHHPWDPPSSELGRVDWRELDLPAGHPGSPDAIRKVLAQKPAHWLAVYEGELVNLEGAAANYRPQRITDDMIREVNAKTHVMVELIDEAVGAVLARLEQRGLLTNTDVVFTTDHGEMQGDDGFLFKGPFHTDSLMRLPFIWRPAATAGIAPGVVSDPVGQVDLAPTFCAIAGVEPPEWMQGRPLPTADDQGTHQRALCEWDSQIPGYGMHLRSIVRDGWLCTAYDPSTAGQPNGLEKVEIIQQLFGDVITRPIAIQYDGSEGELYRLDEDPHQWNNLWDDAGYRSIRDDLVADLRDSLPTDVRHLEVEAPV